MRSVASVIDQVFDGMAEISEEEEDERCIAELMHCVQGGYMEDAEPRWWALLGPGAKEEPYMRRYMKDNLKLAAWQGTEELRKAVQVRDMAGGEEGGENEVLLAR